MPTIVAMAKELSSQPAASSPFHVWMHALAVLGLMAAGGLLIARAGPWLIDDTGHPSPVAFLATNPVGAGIVVLVVVMLAGILAAALAHWTGSRAATFGFGVSLCALPLSAGTAAGSILSGQALTLYPVETLLSGGLITAIIILIRRTGRGRENLAPRFDPGHIGLIIGLVLGAAIGLAAAWVIAVRTVPGQTLAAAIVGSLVAAIVIRIISTDAPITPIVISVFMAAALAQAWTWWRLPAPRIDALQSMFREGTVPPWIAIRPFDWMAGAPLGAVLGCLWSDSFRTEDESD